ncbi:hypothetical protein DL766_004272 [Monosporascus sp. MC13-8B]|uniref:Heterokaryon incompatibility domain-containing protein n=1 Tax=Monosporascus cannonballus TaxID=155416 RepID=A0ABY0HAD7_9PEZI|nr:hypothetical protein DL762_003488 [Monosporascus cannonballus]RYO98574.1 hypothetical protein DL763_002104 [Monosporascus cannonballus]RYP31730.1 hypothetical protein DL766_004272 [Monosporascus sp. MC13-8B]
MHQYYKSALVTIAAADGSNCHAGLFRERDGLRYQPGELQVTGIDGAPRQLYAFTNSMSFELKRSSLSDSFKPVPLYSRAWVFQEQALSPRILTYARDRVSWRCQEMIFDERAPLAKSIDDFIREDRATDFIRRGGDPRSTDAAMAQLQEKWIFPRLDTPSPSRSIRNIGYHGPDCYSPGDEFPIAWGDIVAEYTRRKLTYQTDKLAAIQGIADAVAPLVSRTYFAGIWVDSPRSVLMGLVWSSRFRGVESHRVDIAPSWSWASTDCEVLWSGHMLCRLEPKADIAIIKDLTAAGKFTGELVIETNVRLASKGEGHALAITTWSESSVGELKGKVTTVYQASRWPIDNREIVFGMDEDLGENTQLWIAELAAGVNHNLRSRKEVHCLVLLACDGTDTAFRRVGYSVWEEQKWENEELPELKRKKLTIL